jgi:hypothetical protein
MRKIGFKAVGTLLTLRRHSKRSANWTLAIAVFSTLVTIGLVALYLMQETPLRRAIGLDQFVLLDAVAAASVAYFLADAGFVRFADGLDNTLEDTFEASSCASVASFMAATISSRTTLYSPTASAAGVSAFPTDASGDGGTIASGSKRARSNLLPINQAHSMPVILSSSKISVLTVSTVMTGPPDFRITRSPDLKTVIF